jgi:hypothetical protein
VLLVSGLVCGTVAFNGWRAAPAKAATLFSFDFHSGGRGVRFYDVDAKNGDQEGEVPEASANLASGPVGYGLAAVAWPGPIAANAGTLILVLRPDAPPQATMLNDPVRAEARTGQNPPTTTNSSVPGTSMTATAKTDLVESDANVQGTTSDAGTFGPTHAHSHTTNGGGTGKADATSLVQNISFGGGVIKIDSVSSTAEAHTDGVKADGSAGTVVNGMTVNGTPATVDENGLHIGDSSQPVNKAINDAAVQALSQAGISVVVSAPTKEVKGGSAQVTAGSLVISWATGAGNPTFIWSIGGAQASVAAAPASDEPVASLTDDTVSSSGGSGLGSLSDTSAAGVSPGGLGVATGEAGSGSPLVAQGTTGATDGEKRSFTPAAFTGHPTRIGWVVLGLLAALLAGLGLRRLTDDLLADRAVTACPLQEEQE